MLVDPEATVPQHSGVHEARQDVSKLQVQGDVVSDVLRKFVLDLGAASDESQMVLASVVDLADIEEVSRVGATTRLVLGHGEGEEFVFNHLGVWGRDELVDFQAQLR